MLLTTFLNLLSALLGLLAGAFLIHGSARISDSEIQEVTETYLARNPKQVKQISNQRADYKAGGLALLLSYAAQIAANLPDSTVLPERFPSSLSVACASLLILFLLLAAICYLVRLGDERKSKTPL